MKSIHKYFFYTFLFVSIFLTQVLWGIKDGELMWHQYYLISFSITGLYFMTDKKFGNKT